LSSGSAAAGSFGFSWSLLLTGKGFDSANAACFAAEDLAAFQLKYQ